MVSPALEIVFVDVDDTLVRSAVRSASRSRCRGSRPGSEASGRNAVLLEHWGAEYARVSAREVGLEDCFVSFLPKPTIMIDDQPPAEWRLCRCVHPFNVASIDAES